MTAQSHSETPQSETPLFELPPRYRELQSQARALAVSLRAVAAEADESERAHPVVRKALADSGLVAAVVPAAHGGRDERVDSLAVTVVREALAAESAHLDSMFAMQGIGSYALSVAGSPELQAAWLPRVASLEAVAALALTEPDVGSDLRAITTTAVRDGEDLVLTGRKSFITNAGDAAFYLVLATEQAEPAAQGGLAEQSGAERLFSLVLVPADAAGLRVEHPHQIIAPHILGDVVLDGVRVPAGHRVGAPGQGFQLALATLATFRVSVAGAAVGLAQRALDEAVRHTTSRTAFGTPLAGVGAVSQALAACWTDIEMARALTYRAAAAAAQDARGSLHLSSLAKIGATEAAGRVVDRCVQVMGRFGLVRGSVIERLYREARPMRIYEGATEVIQDSLARQLIKRSPA